MRDQWVARSRAEAVAQAFGLGLPAGVLEPVSFRTSQTWRLVTANKTALIKHVAAEDWFDDFVRAMAYERSALDAGISMATPLHPASGSAPTAGSAVRIDGIGWVRAYEWVEGRALDDGDDVAEWLGATLARLHALAPRPGATGGKTKDAAATGASNAGTTDAAGAGVGGGGAPEWYRLDVPELWRGWLVGGERTGRPWAALLRDNLAEIVDAAAWVARAFLEAGDYVVTHRDVEPWNVLMSADGPVLIDWDVAGPDSASLEAAHATLEFARRGRNAPDLAAVRRTLEAYVGNGGTPFGGPDVLARRAGLRLGRLAERLRMSLGDQELGPHDLAAVERRAAEQIAETPAFVAALRNYRL